MIAGMYDFSNEEIAAMLHISKASAGQWFNAALDALAEIFLEAGLLSEQRPDRRQRQVARLPRKGPRRVDFPIEEEPALDKVC